MEEEREFSVYLSVASSMYTRLSSILQQASSSYYTETKVSIKNAYIHREYVVVDDVNGSKKFVKNFRTVQDMYGYSMQTKTRISQKNHRCLYRYRGSNLTFLLDICERVSMEEEVDLNDYIDKCLKYKQTIRDYIYCRESGMRIAIERRYEDYIDPDYTQMSYDCFNRYNFNCFIHVEWEYEKGVENALEKFKSIFVDSDVIHELLSVISNKNLNCVGDEIINIENMPLTHKYGYLSSSSIGSKEIVYFSMKFDGQRKNFCIFGKYIQIGQKCFVFENHWFGQAIIGHCEILEKTNEIILIDVYIITADYSKIAKGYNMTYTKTLQNYHSYSTQIAPDNIKTQDEYFHMKRLKNNIKFLEPLEAIHILELLSHVWSGEPKLSQQIQLQKFYTSLKKLQRQSLMSCPTKIDGFLGFSRNTIYKIKQTQTIDLLFKFDEMFRHVLKDMKTHMKHLKKMIKFVNLQKTMDWCKFEENFPGMFEQFAIDFLYFSKDQSFIKHYPNWSIQIDMEDLILQVSNLNSTQFILLIEFEIDQSKKMLSFTRLRSDKFSANSYKVFENILKQVISV